MCHWQNGMQDSCGLWSNESQGLLHLKTESTLADKENHTVH